MFGLFRKSLNLPQLSEFSLLNYTHDFSLDRLVPGVDNIRYDVHISQVFVTATQKIIEQLIVRHAGLEERLAESKQKEGSWIKQIDRYKRLYQDLLEEAVNRAKGDDEIQIEYLAQTALCKLLIEQVNAQFERVLRRLKKSVRKSELATHNDFTESPKLKGKLQRLLQERDTILKQVGLEIFGFWGDVEKKHVRPVHEAVFSKRAAFFEDCLTNPMLHVSQPGNEYFMLSEYDLVLGKRIEDPDKYETLLYLIRRMLNIIDAKNPAAKGVPVDRRMALTDLQDDDEAVQRQRNYKQKIDSMLLYPDNVNRLLDWQKTKEKLAAIKKRDNDRAQLADLKKKIKHQKQVLQFFYRQFCQSGVMDHIAASYVMQPEYQEYCPPLLPQQIVQYLAVPRSRKVVKSRLKRMKKVYGRVFSLRPLAKKIKTMEQMVVATKKVYLVRFMKALLRFHRDWCNAELIREAMERVHLATDEKALALSRENHTLYEFLLPQEQVSDKAPIINHVVIKADVRGSTDITHQMIGRGLNPASYFSLNFFDPISAILPEYGASKIFIEGDALILSLFEHKDTPGGWYSVARACGLALNMLMIIQRYNEKSRRYHLPILELGIGIVFREDAPTFLFDGNNRIMISSAINLADRLSSCSKTGRKMFANKRSPFNLYTFQTLSDEAMAHTSDDLFSRFNVNGIELNSAGFEKLSREIDLKLMQGDVKDLFGQKSSIYYGRFPTEGGHLQTLVIREAQVPVVDPDTLKLEQISSRKYYEVCTHPKLYAHVRKRGK
jgi:hypothetical protein